MWLFLSMVEEKVFIIDMKNKTAYGRIWTELDQKTEHSHKRRQRQGEQERKREEREGSQEKNQETKIIKRAHSQ